MIKKLLSIALIAVGVTANAQQLQVAKLGKENVSNHYSIARGANPSASSVTIDTLLPASIMTSGCAVGTNTALAGLVYYSVDQVAPYDSGYYFGTNIFPQVPTTTTELAQKYNVTGTVTVTDVLVWAGVATGSVTTTTAKIYTENATTHKPATALGTSTPLPMSSYNTTGYTTFNFPTAVNVPAGNFFAGITIPAFGGTDQDTLAILTTKIGCPTSGDSLSAIKLQTYGWQLTKPLFGARADVMIFPVINITTTGVNSVSRAGLSLFAASPNPASNTININFSLANSSKVEIDVYDVTGKIVKTVKGGDFAAGKGSVAVDVTNLDAGSYMYSINTNSAKIFSKFVVTK